MAIDPKKQLPKGPQTSNELFFDAIIRHQIFLLRASGSITKDVIAILNATEKDLANRIRNDLAKIGRGLTPRNRQKLRQLIKEIQAIRSPAWDEIRDKWFQDFRAIVKNEPLFLDTAAKSALPVLISTSLPSVSELTSLVTNNPFEGRTLSQWASKIERDDINRIRNQITIGLVQGETGQQIARRVVGTARLKGTDGVTQITRREAATITRTAVNAYSNMAKREFYLDNKDIIKGEIYVAVLDSRTCWSLDTLIAMADGNQKRIGDISEGDFVLGGLSGKPSKVIGIHKTIENSSVVIYNENNRCIGRTTHEHEILIRDGWEKVGFFCQFSKIQELLCRNFNDFFYKEDFQVKEQKGEIEIISISLEDDNTYITEDGIISHNTPICRSLDGQIFEVGVGPIPPLHFQCRSVRAAFFNDSDLATRPSKPTTEKMLLREFTAGNNLQTVSTRVRLPRGFKGKFDAFSRTRTRELIGQVPAKVNYQEWIGRQSVSFQNDVLGVTKARLFRKGGLTLDKFVNRRGDELNLKQLVTRDRQAFIDAGLDPDDFN